MFLSVAILCKNPIFWGIPSDIFFNCSGDLLAKFAIPLALVWLAFPNALPTWLKTPPTSIVPPKSIAPAIPASDIFFPIGAKGKSGLSNSAISLYNAVAPAPPIPAPAEADVKGFCLPAIAAPPPTIAPIVAPPILINGSTILGKSVG